MSKKNFFLLLFCVFYSTTAVISVVALVMALLQTFRSPVLAIGSLLIMIANWGAVMLYSALRKDE